MKSDKTKVCPIFEPTYNSICHLSSDKEKLFFFKALCEYAFHDIEPEWTDESNLYECLWIQFRVAIDQAKKRAAASAKNGEKGGRPIVTSTPEEASNKQE